MITQRGSMSTAVDYYFKTDDDLHFIKLSESNVTREQLQESMGNPITAICQLKNGTWDKHGNEVVQSRTGDYLVIIKIK